MIRPIRLVRTIKKAVGRTVPETVEASTVRPRMDNMVSDRQTANTDSVDNTARPDSRITGGPSSWRKRGGVRPGRE